MQRYDRPSVQRLLERVASGELAVEEALSTLRDLPFASMVDARVDHHRSLRTGVPEVVFAERKSREQIGRLMRALYDGSGFALATRVVPDDGAALAATVPEARYEAVGRVLCYGTLPRSGHRIGVVSAGTSDLPVAEEAAAVLEAFGHDVARATDVGVAGLHRLLPDLATLDECAAVVVVAGMEGALPSVVGGMIHRPIIAVPTSVGYGASFGGLAALLAMLNSCAPGVAVVNIDNGFGAACVAHKIVQPLRVRRPVTEMPENSL